MSANFYKTTDLQKNLLTALVELIGPEATAKLQAEFGGVQLYFPFAEEAPEGFLCRSRKPASDLTDAQRIDLMAGALLKAAEALMPASSKECHLMTEALVLVLMRRLGPASYGDLARWIPLSKV